MASTPAVGPSPTTRTNSSPHTSSGIDRNTTSVQRTSWRQAAGHRPIGVASALSDSREVASSASGTAASHASASPAVAMATVRQVSRSSSARKSASWRGGTKSDTNFQLAPRLRASASVAGLNSVHTSSGQANTAATSSSDTRRSTAGSRCAAAVVRMA